MADVDFSHEAEVDSIIGRVKECGSGTEVDLPISLQCTVKEIKEDLLVELRQAGLTINNDSDSYEIRLFLRDENPITPAEADTLETPFLTGNVLGIEIHLKGFSKWVRAEKDFTDLEVINFFMQEGFR